MTFGVLAAYRQLGLGSSMLQKIIHDAQSADTHKVGLHVHIDNAAALKFYIRRGFKTVGRVDNYYVRIVPNSAYILELDLRTSLASDT
jgi:ribosomal protein S18 acetylase RimI-like enzyme